MASKAARFFVFSSFVIADRFRHVHYMHRIHSVDCKVFGFCNLYRLSHLSWSSPLVLCSLQILGIQTLHLYLFHFCTFLSFSLHKVINHTHPRSASSSPTLHSCHYHHLRQPFTFQNMINPVLLHSHYTFQQTFLLSYETEYFFNCLPAWPTNLLHSTLHPHLKSSKPVYLLCPGCSFEMQFWED